MEERRPERGTGNFEIGGWVSINPDHRLFLLRF